MTATTGLLPERYSGAQPIGRGGMGEIYRATDTSLGRAVAVKVLDERYAEDEGVRERFTREALAVARLSGNAHIVTIYDVGEWRGRPFIVMEYLAGGSLAERIANEGPQPPGVALDWLEQAAAALDAAHREGVVHRDVKPGNLLFDRHGRVHVADFGIASAAGLASLTQTGTVMGTASYISPEQAQGAHTSPASDLYALAVVAYELLAGRRPFEGDTAAAEAAAHVTGDVPSVSSVNPSLPPELDAVFARALAKDPARRFGSCGELVAALRAAFDRAAGSTAIVAAAPSAAPTRVVRRPARRRLPVWLPAALGVLLLGALGGGIAAALTHRSGSAAPPPQRSSVSVRTVTAPGTTVVTTAPPPTTTASAGGDPYTLNNQAYALMNQGNYAAALPLLQNAVSQLQGHTDLTTAYANYNLGVTLMQLGRCGEAIPYLETSRSLQPQRHEVKDALKQARRCSD